MKWAWEPDALRGEKVLSGASAAHVAVNGTEAEKTARWQSMVNDVTALQAKGSKLTAARKIVAKSYGVSTKTVQRAPENLKKHRTV